MKQEQHAEIMIQEFEFDNKMEIITAFSHLRMNLEALNQTCALLSVFVLAPK